MLKEKKRNPFMHVIQLALALMMFISFLMPMFTISPWKNVALKNGANGNGIAMAQIGAEVSENLAGIVRKAKLQEGVTTTIADDAALLSLAGVLVLIGFCLSAMLVIITFTEMLGVNYGGKRKPIVLVTCCAVVICLAVSIFCFASFDQKLQTAASEKSEALEKVTAKLLQDGQIPVLKVGVWAYAALIMAAGLFISELAPKAKRGHTQSLLWFVLPALLMYSFFVILPALQSVYLGFTSYDGITEASMRFVGLENYKTIFSSARFGAATGNTIIIAVSFTLLVNVFALFLAMVVDKVRWGKNVFRGAFYIPVLISGIIAGFIWRIMFNYSFGIINFVLNAIGIDSMKFIDTMPNALLSIIFVLLWKQVGYYMIIYLAALQGISQDLLEAASIDGASGARTFRHITLPLLAGSFTINLTLALINGLKVFDEIAILTDGGPGFSTETITYMVYKVAFGEMRQGYGTAMAVILFLLILVLGGVQSTILRKREVQL